MKVRICLGSQILAEGIRRILSENLPQAVLSDDSSIPQVSDPDVVLFDSRQVLEELMERYPAARFICIDLGLKDAELACLLLCHEINGIISPHLDVEMFCKAVCAVHKGEIWVEQTHLKTMLRQGRGLPRREEIHGLSPQDRLIIKLTSQGMRNRDIADQLCLSEATVKAHMSRIFRTLNVENRAQLVALATESGWQSPLP